MTKKNISITPVILAGGAGTRLWPLSRSEKPKQFLNLLGKYSLLQLTALRIKNYIFADPIIIAGESHRFLVAEQLNMIGFKKCKIILEPFPRNTAAAVAVAAIYLEKKNLHNNMLILSADHYIGNIKNFRKSVNVAINHANQNKLVCLGIKPSYASSEFGYILYEKTRSEGILVRSIKQFIEKPSRKLAQNLISKKALWNSGIFCFNYKTILEEIEAFEPTLFKLTKKALEKSKSDRDFLRLDKNIFKKVKSISIDNSIFENTKKALVVETNFSWSDLGTYNALWKIDKKDKNNNIIKGDIITDNVKNSYILTDKNLVSVSNLNNIILIATKDAVMAANLNKSESIKTITDFLNKQKRIELVEHPIAHRPWGYYENIISERNYKVKKLFIYPGKRISLQEHKKRSEHWIVISGKARVTRDGKVFYLLRNQSTYIPKLTKHRLENNTRKPLIIIEVQTGSYFGEDDIKRFDDEYGRK